MVQMQHALDLVDKLVHEVAREEWGGAIAGIREADLSLAANAAGAQAVLYAEASAYLDARANYGMKHNEAMQEYEAMRKKVRKALGYSYP